MKVHIYIDDFCFLTEWAACQEHNVVDVFQALQKKTTLRTDKIIGNDGALPRKWWTNNQSRTNLHVVLANEVKVIPGWRLFL